MGFYINPPNCTPLGKSRWLNENGVALPTVPTWDDIPADCCVVCCVNNGAFEAAAIADTSRELSHFAEPDGRSKQWFYIEKKVAVENSPIEMIDFT